MVQRAPIVPILFARDFHVTAQFYQNVLGFDVSSANVGMLATREQMSLLFYLANDHTNVGGLSVILQAPDVRDLHCEYLQRQVSTLSGLRVARHQPLKFSIRDTDGNDLLFVGSRSSLSLYIDGELQNHRYGANQ